MSKPLVALIDGDELVYLHACAAETISIWDDGLATKHADGVMAMAKVDEHILDIQEAVGADSAIVCLSDSKGNFRKDLDSGYKRARKVVEKPLLFTPLREHMETVHSGVIRSGLEADDVMGILATRENPSTRTIIVSQDKDMKTIPGLYWNGRDKQPDGEGPMIYDISVAQADFFHMTQALAGDPTDGYSGCPGIGIPTARTALSELIGIEMYESEFKSGPRKGKTETRKRKAPLDTLWDVVVSYYKAAGLEESDALLQARLARILRAPDYDFNLKEPILWTPPTTV